ncbi:MAG: hypothetical protein FJZ62_02110 [Chlamydiae bacterium]|nr:hypothetical protein [Chlamydiota bacterium]
MKLFTIIYLFLIFLPFFGEEPVRTRKNLVIIVASDKLLVYKAHTYSWRRYMHKFKDNFECWFVKSDPDLEVDHKFEKDVLWVKEVDSLCPGVMDKTLHAMEVFLPRLDEFDFIIRPNQSSFLVFPTLLNFLNRLPLEKTAAGDVSTVQFDGTKVPFLGGACYIVSKDVVRLMLENKDSLMHLPPKLENWDDLVLTRFLFSQNISPINHPIINLEGAFRRPLKIFDQFDEKVFHFRIKTHRDDYGRYRAEKIIHDELFQIYYNGLFSD